MMQQAPQELPTMASVLQALSAFNTCPAGAKELLAQGLLRADAHTADGLSEQKAFADFATSASGALQEAKQRALEERAVCDAALRELEAELQAREAAVAEAEDAAAQAAAQQVLKGSLHEAAQRVVEQEQLKHDRAQHDGETSAAAWADVRAAQARASALADGPLRMLVQGGWEDEDVKCAAVGAVVDHLTEIRAEKILTAAAQVALAVQPGNRKPFDRLTVQAVTEIIFQFSAALDAEVAKVVPEEVQMRAELVGLWAIADCARDEAARAAEEVRSAARALKAALSAVAVARQRSAEQEAALGEQGAALLRAEAHLREVEGAAAALEAISAGAGAKAPPGGGDVEMAAEACAAEAAAGGCAGAAPGVAAAWEAEAHAPMVA